MAFISPPYGRKVQNIAKRYSGKIYAHLQNLPRTLRRLGSKQVKFVHRTVYKSAEKGKKGRRNAPL